MNRIYYDERTDWLIIIIKGRFAEYKNRIDWALCRWPYTAQWKRGRGRSKGYRITQAPRDFGGIK